MSRTRNNHDTRAGPAKAAAANKREDSPHKVRKTKTRTGVEDDIMEVPRWKKKGAKSHAQVENDGVDYDPRQDETVKPRAQFENTEVTEDAELELDPHKGERDKISAQTEANEVYEAKAAPHEQKQDNNRSQAEKSKLKVSISRQRNDTTTSPVTPSRKGKRIRYPPKLAEGMVNNEHPNTIHTYRVESATLPVAVDVSDNNAAPSKSKPTTTGQKTSTKILKKKSSPSPGHIFPGLARRAADQKEQARRRAQSQDEVDEEVTERSARLADRLVTLTKMNQELWLESQTVLDEFLEYVGYVGDEGDVSEARAKFDGLRKRKIKGENYDWPMAKRGKGEGADD